MREHEDPVVAEQIVRPVSALVDEPGAGDADLCAADMCALLQQQIRAYGLEAYLRPEEVIALGGGCS